MDSNSVKTQGIDLVLFIGQSNMAGRGIASKRWPQKAPKLIEGAAWEYRAISQPDRLQPLEEPFGVNENVPGGINDVFSGNEKAKTGSLVTAFCNAYYENTGRVIVGISASKGGSTITEWLPGDPLKTGYYMDMMKRMQMAESYLCREQIPIRRRFAVWSQGESDGDVGTTKDAYKTLFHSFWTCLSDVVDVLFIIKTGHCNQKGCNDRYLTIQMAQEEIAREEKNVHIVSRIFGEMLAEGLMKDAFHYYQHGYNLCGEEAGRNAAVFFAGNNT